MEMSLYIYGRDSIETIKWKHARVPDYISDLQACDELSLSKIIEKYKGSIIEKLNEYKET